MATTKRKARVPKPAPAPPAITLAYEPLKAPGAEAAPETDGGTEKSVEQIYLEHLLDRETRSKPHSFLRAHVEQLEHLVDALKSQLQKEVALVLALIGDRQEVRLDALDLARIKRGTSYSESIDFSTGDIHLKVIPPVTVGPRSKSIWQHVPGKNDYAIATHGEVARG